MVFDYDFAGRVGNLTTPRGDYSAAYDASTGLMKQLTSPDGVILTFGYVGGRLTDETWAGLGTVSVTLDEDERVTSEFVNGTHTVTFDHDADGLLSTAGQLGIEWDSQSALVAGTSLGSVTTAVTYNAFGARLTEEASFNSSVFSSRTYVPDAVDRLSGVTETLGGSTVTFAYTYDSAGHLATVTEDGSLTATYSYDQNGNRLSVTRSHSTVEATYDAQDRISTYGSLVFTHDETGNVTAIANTVTGARMTLTFDILGNLTTAGLPDGRQIDYVTDGSLRRVLKKVDGTVVQGWLYGEDGRPVAEVDGTGTVVARFVYGTWRSVPDYVVKNGQTYQLLPDIRGSPRLVIDTSSGAVVQRLSYDEFGVITEDTSPGFQPFGFGGGLYDPDTGLVRFGARDYFPFVGRWVAKDPNWFASGQANLYSYVHNDPINFIDPTGEEEEHTNNARPSTKGRHEDGQARKDRDRHRGEKGDDRRRPPGRHPNPKPKSPPGKPWKRLPLKPGPKLPGLYPLFLDWPFFCGPYCIEPPPVACGGGNTASGVGS
jgi:RHS repeat-associated protein